MRSLQFNDKNTAIRLMNDYGSKKNPFFFIIDFDQKNSIILPLDSIPTEEILFSTNNVNNCGGIQGDYKSKLCFSKQPLPYEEYEVLFRKVKHEISYGNTYLLNLTCPTPVNINLTMKEIFLRSKARYKLWFGNRFIVFSPETFITIRKGIISSFPMKGTIDANLPDARQMLLTDPKEIAEHYTIVDLIRNDLSSVARQVKVDDFRYIERLENNFGALLQVSSKVSGRLPSNYHEHIGDILFKLLPAGSISGAPKEKTIHIIHETEEYERGFYTGIFGYFDGNVLDSGVMIRFIESTEKGLIFKSGGGITSFSDSLKEYQEMIDKVYVPFS